MYNISNRSINKANQRTLLYYSVGASRQKHSLPELPYEYSALEPVISREIMSLHHSKHHATYINNLNAAEEKLAQAQAKGCTDVYLKFY